MFWLKACPKCHGDLYRENDVYGAYIACLQCSRYLTNAEEARFILPSGKQPAKSCFLAQQEKTAV